MQNILACQEEHSDGLTKLQASLRVKFPWRWIIALPVFSMTKTASGRILQKTLAPLRTIGCIEFTIIYSQILVYTASLDIAQCALWALPCSTCTTSYWLNNRRVLILGNIGGNKRYTRATYIHSFPAAWAVVLINVGLAQARPNNYIIIINNVILCQEKQPASPLSWQPYTCCSWLDLSSLT